MPISYGIAPVIQYTEPPKKPGFFERLVDLLFARISILRGGR